jgi:hypothetical protein
MPVEYDQIKSNITKMLARYRGRTQEIRLTKNLLSMAYEGWAGKIPKMPGEPTGKDKRTVTPDLLGFLLRSFSYLYRTEPVRYAPDEMSAEILNRKLWTYDDGLSATLTTADSLARICGTVLVGLTWVPSPDGSIQGDDDDGYQTEVITSDCFEVLPSADPRYPRAVIAKMGCGWMYWDDVASVALNAKWEPVGMRGPEGQGVMYLEHGYGAPPFVVVQNLPRWGETIAPRMGNDDLYRSMCNLGAHIRELGWTAMLQRGQPWMSGEKKEQLVLAPDAIVQVGQGGTFNIAANNANLDGMTNALRSILDLFATSLGLPSRTFRVERASAVSGVAIMLDQQELEADRQQRAVIFRGAERRLARQVARMEAAAGTEISGDMSVTFRQPDPIISFDERLKRVQWQWRAGLISPEDAVAELYPSATPDEVHMRVERARAAAAAGQVELLGAGGRTPATGGAVQLTVDDTASDSAAGGGGM